MIIHMWYNYTCICKFSCIQLPWKQIVCASLLVSVTLIIIFYLLLVFTVCPKWSIWKAALCISYCGILYNIYIYIMRLCIILWLACWASRKMTSAGTQTSTRKQLASLNTRPSSARLWVVCLAWLLSGCLFVRSYKTTQSRLTPEEREHWPVPTEVFTLCHPVRLWNLSWAN